MAFEYIWLKLLHFILLRNLSLNKNTQNWYEYVLAVKIVKNMTNSKCRRETEKKSLLNTMLNDVFKLTFTWKFFHGEYESVKETFA